MKHKFKLSILFMLVFGVIGYFAGVLINYFTGDGVEFVEALSSSMALILLGVGANVGLGMGLFTPNKKSNIKTTTTGVTGSGEETDINFDSKFITEDKLRTSPDLIFTTWNNLPSLKKTGFVFRNKEVNGRYEINMKP